MAYDLTPEQLAARQAAAFTAGEAFDFEGGHFLSNWRREDQRDCDYADIYVVVHGEWSWRETFRHRIPVVVDLPEKDDMPARRMLTSRQLTCRESVKWQKHLAIRKVEKCPPTCPGELLANYIREHGELSDKELFRFGDDATTHKGEPEKPVVLTGYDLINKNTTNWKEDHNILARGQHVAVVIPLGGTKSTSQWESAEDDLAAKIMLGGFGLIGKFQAEIDRAIKIYGDDVANPRFTPAVYQIVYDQRKKGGKKSAPADIYSVHFVERYSVPAAAEEIGGSSLDSSLVAELKKLTTPAPAREFYDLLNAGLVADLPLAEIMGIDPDAPDEEREPDVFDEQIAKNKAAAKAAPAKAPAPAPATTKPAANGITKPAGKRNIKRKPAAAPTVPGEPCPVCTTFWPEADSRCPSYGKKGPNGVICDAIAGDDDDELAADETSELPFADD